MNNAPGWYHAEGDPADTHRWWDGVKWIGNPSPIDPQPQAVGSAAPPAFPGAPPAMTTGLTAHDRSPIEWMMLPFKRYAEFDGRSSRAEYWWFQLLYIGVMLVTFLPGIMLMETSAIGILFFAIGVIAVLGMLIPGIAVTVRRLHDTDRSGGWIVIGMIPIVNYIGSFVLLFFYASEGDRGRNQYGPSPYESPATQARQPASSGRF